MRSATFVIGVALLGTVSPTVSPWTGMVLARDVSTPLATPESIQPTARLIDYSPAVIEEYMPAASNRHDQLAMAPVPEAPVPEDPVPEDPVPEDPVPEDLHSENDALPLVGSGDQPCCRTQCDACRGCDCCGPKPFKLPQPCMLQCLGINVGGWAQQGVTFNGLNPTGGTNGTVNTNYLDGDYMLNQLWLYLDRPVNTGGHGWDVGGRIDLVYGSDWPHGTSFGLEDNINSPGQTHGMILPQMYLEFAVNDLTLRAGHWAVMAGYEVIPAPMNPFYSHSFSICTEPLLVTGMQLDYKLSDRVNVFGGFNRGWSMWEDINNDLDFLGGIRFNSEDQRTSMSFITQTGAWDPAGQNNQWTGIFVLKQQIMERWTYAFQNNIGVADDQAPGGRDAEWYSIVQWLLYKINDKWTAGARVEWFRDDDGTRVLTWENGPRYGLAGDLTEVTAGLNWRPHPSIVFRPEVRWDWFSGDAPGGLPFNGGQDDHQFTCAMDLVITF